MRASRKLRALGYGRQRDWLRSSRIVSVKSGDGRFSVRPRAFKTNPIAVQRGSRGKLNWNPQV